MALSIFEPRRWNPSWCITSSSSSCSVRSSVSDSIQRTTATISDSLYSSMLPLPPRTGRRPPARSSLRSQLLGLGSPQANRRCQAESRGSPIPSTACVKRCDGGMVRSDRSLDLQFPVKEPVLGPESVKTPSKSLQVFLTEAIAVASRGRRLICGAVALDGKHHLSGQRPHRRRR